MLQNIELYLKKFADFGLKETLLKEEIIKAIKEETNVDLKEEDLSIQNGIVRVNVSGSAKTEIFIKKKNIQERMEKSLNIL